MVLQKPMGKRWASLQEFPMVTQRVTALVILTPQKVSVLSLWVIPMAIHQVTLQAALQVTPMALSPVSFPAPQILPQIPPVSLSK